MARRRSPTGAVTIDQVAERCGVSKTTVSRYLNGRYDLISETTCQKIREVIEEMHYRPNRIAQSLKARNSRLIGCLVSDIGSPFSSILVKGINSVCLDNDYQLLLVDCGDDAARERKAITDLLENQVDGLIVNTTGQNDDFLLSLKDRGVPIVLADRCLSAPGLMDTVATENYRCTYSCIAYLHELGYQKVAFFTQGNGTVSPRIIRYHGFDDAMRAIYGLKGEDLLFQIRPDDREDCLRQIEAYRSRYPGERLAVFAVNGVAMLQILQAARSDGIELGAKFGACGFDDWGWADLIPPGITTITQDSWLVGRRSAKLLLERIAGEGPAEPVYDEIPNKLEIRGSTVKG